MKWSITCCLISVVCASPVWADCFSYRTSSGEVEGATVETFSFPPESYFDEVCDPVAPDGTSLVPTKIWTGSEMRNATPAELSGFPAFVDADALDRDKNQAKARVDDGNRHGILIKALALVVLDEVNVIRARMTAVEGCISNASNLQSAKACTDGLADLTPRTKAQLLNAVKATIDADLAN